MIKKFIIILTVLLIALPVCAELYYKHSPNCITQQAADETPAIDQSCYYYVFLAWHLFNQKVTSDGWVCDGGESDISAMIILSKAQSITEYTISAMDSGYNIYNATQWVLYGSNDGTCTLGGNWTEVDSRAGQTDWAEKEMRRYTLPAVSQAYKCWKITVLAPKTETVPTIIAEIELIYEPLQSAPWIH